MSLFPRAVAASRRGKVKDRLFIFLLFVLRWTGEIIQPTGFFVAGVLVELNSHSGLALRGVDHVMLMGVCRSASLC